MLFGSRWLLVRFSFSFCSVSYLDRANSLGRVPRYSCHLQMSFRCFDVRPCSFIAVELAWATCWCSGARFLDCNLIKDSMITQTLWRLFFFFFLKDKKAWFYFVFDITLLV